MASPVPNTGWSYFFFPLTVYGANYYGAGYNREWPVGTGGDQFFVTEEGTLLLTDYAATFASPYVTVTVYEVNEDGSGSAYVLFSFLTEEAFAQLIGESVTFDDGSSATIDASAGVFPGQSFGFGGPDPPVRVASVGKLIPVS
jgi:hypothetical protein